MAKPEWGTKRRCNSCGAVFYDMRKDPIICPRCDTVFQPELLLKPKRGRPDEKAQPKPVVRAPVADVVADDEALETVADDAIEEEFIEDAAELGEDDADVAEVIEGTDEEPAPGER